VQINSEEGSAFDRRTQARIYGGWKIALGDQAREEKAPILRGKKTQRFKAGKGQERGGEIKSDESNQREIITKGVGLNYCDLPSEKNRGS